jgi:hypothetical protein
MVKEYDINSVLIKLVYYCNIKREVYFKRADVTEYLMSNNIFEIPNKQGFDGNLSYFGWDIQNDNDGDRILLLRGQNLNEKCLEGAINFQIQEDFIRIDTDENIINEIDNLIKNKTKEAGMFRLRSKINEENNLQECSYRIFGNKKLYIKEGKRYYYSRILIDEYNNQVIYEIVNSPRLYDYEPKIVFPIFDEQYTYTDVSFKEYEDFYYDEVLGVEGKDFCYFVYQDEGLKEIDIQNYSNNKLIDLINEYEYDLTGKDTTKKVLTNARLNTGTLRSVALSRDDNKCLLCELSDSRLLVCSHIKPWRTGESRLDKNNVLTLCSIHDALFDKGFIAFSDDGKVLYSENDIFDSEIMKSIKNVTNDRLRCSNYDKMKENFQYHRENIFLV